MPNIQNITLEKMKNNECDIYSKTNTNCTFYIQRFELFNTERLCSLLQVCIQAATHLST